MCLWGVPRPWYVKIQLKKNNFRLYFPAFAPPCRLFPYLYVDFRSNCLCIMVKKVRPLYWKKQRQQRAAAAALVSSPAPSGAASSSAAVSAASKSSKSNTKSK